MPKYINNEEPAITKLYLIETNLLEYANSNEETSEKLGYVKKANGVNLNQLAFYRAFKRI